MAIEPGKISELTQVQRNALIAALGCKSIHRMNNGDSLPEGFEPDELIIDTGDFTTENLLLVVPIGYLFHSAFAKTNYIDGNALDVMTNEQTIASAVPLVADKFYQMEDISAGAGGSYGYNEPPYTVSFSGFGDEPTAICRAILTFVKI